METGASTYAVSLSFDAAFCKSVASLVESLARVTGNNTLSEKHAPVHLTLGMFHASPSQIPELKRLFLDFCSGIEKELEVDFDGTDSFLEKVIFLSINKSSDSFSMLKSLNERLHELFLPHFEAGANRNYLPEAFFPHVAVAVKLTKEEFEKGISWAHPPTSDGRVFRTSADAPFADSDKLNQRTLRGAPYPCAKIIAVSLAKCNPYKEIERHSLELLK